MEAKMMTRRQFGQVLIGSGVAALGWRAKATGAFEECQGEAYAPWRTWSKFAGLERAVAAATLAASPHNTQPWLFRISGSRVELFADHNRTIGTIDPLLREQHIGIGCALENLLLTAESSGYAVKGLVFDQNPASGRIASVEFANAGLTESTLYRAIPYRHTNRGPYQNGRPIPAGLIQEMERLNADRERIRVVMWTGATQSRMKDLIVAATEQVVADKDQNRDSNQWYRGTRSAIDLHRDGITLDAQGLSGAVRFAAKMMPEPSQSCRSGVPQEYRM
jgi:hypothetical protein